MVWTSSRGPVTVAICATALLAGTFVGMGAQAPPAGQAPGGGGRGGGRGGGVGPVLFTATDANKDGSVTKDEFKSTFDKWFTAWDTTSSGALTQPQIAAGLTAALPQPAPPAGGAQGDPCGGRSASPQVPCPADVEAMMAALPDKAPAKPKQARKILVLAKADGFVHSSIPLAARMVEEIGKKTSAWTTTVSYDASVITADNLKQYDLVFLDSTTGRFLDDPNDATITAARRKALLDFVRGGKGIAGIHAATDSYHGNPNPAPRGGGAGGGRGGFGAGPQLAAAMMTAGDKNADQKLSRDEFGALADTWYEKVDSDKAGKVAQADFAPRFAAAMPPPVAPGGANAGAPAVAQVNEPLWPEFNTLIGGYFKFHWNDPQIITVKIDDTKSPLTAMFKGQPYVIHDETYTMQQNSFSRTNVHVLTSIDYSKMSDEDKAKEPANNRRTDGDYGLSWIRREGKGRVFYEAHGHSERNYAIKPLLEHITAGIQYALGDLAADDSPSVKGSGTGSK